ncbi:hypothetical protein [Loigolactobacillus bifermentans]|uniref:Glycosyltransferase RgtA/B/C/D-like domain-containing protein n=1 Tax=Loigolactobacillus bifermentans DSM 20003 TaxID=1423726 RepID=A0A0R1H6N8_9LACO|nr:hypothetical protein FC07_GL002851 [Loigolactobacillus bifermentans DSM 20003]
MKQAVAKFKKYLSPALFAVLLAAIIVGWLLFVPPIHGLADNGDFYRAINSNGMYKLHDTYLDYVAPKYGIYQYFNENHAAIFSSQPVFVKTALFLNQVFYSHKVFDIRFMGLVYYGLFLGAIYLLTKALVVSERRFRSYVIAALVVLVFGDSSFTLYFNTFFAEPEMYLMLIYAVAALLLLARHCYQRQWPLIVLYFVATSLLVTSKQQNAPLALSFMVGALGLLMLVQSKVRRLALAGLMAVLLAAGVYTYSNINSYFSDINNYHAFTHGVLLYSDQDVSQEIKKFGISEQFGLMRSEDYYTEKYTALKPSSKYVSHQLLSKYNLPWLFKYYALHPKQFEALLDVAARDFMITQVKATGDYVKAAGHKPRAQLTFFTTYSALMGAFFPRPVCLYFIASGKLHWGIWH